MKTITSKDGHKAQLLDTRNKTVEVTATEKSAHKAGSKRLVLEHMVSHLLKKGMIEDPSGKKGK